MRTRTPSVSALQGRYEFLASGAVLAVDTVLRRTRPAGIDFDQQYEEICAVMLPTDTLKCPGADFESAR
jgi:hypothetical protein